MFWRRKALYLLNQREANAFKIVKYDAGGHNWKQGDTVSSRTAYFASSFVTVIVPVLLTRCPFI